MVRLLGVSHFHQWTKLAEVEVLRELSLERHHYETGELRWLIGYSFPRCRFKKTGKVG